MTKRFGVSQSFIEAMKQVRGITAPAPLNESVESDGNMRRHGDKWDNPTTKKLDKWDNPTTKKMAHNNANTYKDKSDKRVAGIVKAVKKMTEGTDIVLDEQLLDELSKETLASYIDKASTDRDHLLRNAKKNAEYASDVAAVGKGKHDKASMRHGMEYAAKSYTKAMNRKDGITKAAYKMAEEAEQIDQLSKNMLRKLTKEETMTNENIDTEYEYMFIDSEGAIVEALDINYDTVELMFAEGIESISTDDIIVEEIEDLAELSQATLKSYTQKAQDSVAATKKKGKPSKAVVALRAKRGMGLERAKEKLHAIYKKESEARMAEAVKASKDVDDHFENNHHDVLTKHGFKLMTSGKHGDKNVKTYSHAHDNGHVTLISVHSNTNDKHMGGIGYKHEVRAVNSKGTSWSTHHPNTGIWDAKDAEDHKREMMPKFENHIIDVKKRGADTGNW